MIGESSSGGASSRCERTAGSAWLPAGQGTAKQVQEAVRAAARVLENAGYVVEELEPPSIELAARTCLDMLNTPDIRAMWQMTAGLLPPDTAVPRAALRRGRRPRPGRGHAS